MASNPRYTIIIKPDVEDYVRERIRERYYTFCAQFGKQFGYEEAEQEVMRCLEIAPVNRSVPEIDSRRCRFEKHEMKSFSPVFETEVRAFFFQDDRGRIRYPVTILRSGLQDQLDGFSNQE